MDVESSDDSNSDIVTIPLRNPLEKRYGNLASYYTNKASNSDCSSSIIDGELFNKPSTSKSKLLEFTKEVLPCVPTEELDKGLTDVSLSVFNQTQLENQQIPLCVHVGKRCDNDRGYINETANSDGSSSVIDELFNKPCTSKSKSLEINKEVIPCVPTEEQDEALLDLGVSVYDQTQFENQVMDQVDKALKAQDEEKRKYQVARNLENIEVDIRLAKKHLKQIQKALAMAPKDSAAIPASTKREIAAKIKEQENKLKHLKKLEAKQRTLQACYSGNADDVNSLQENYNADNDDIDDETRYHLQQVLAAEETEEDRLIRVGEMTPFGTTSQSNVKKARRILIPENGLTEFDRCLLSVGEVKAKNRMKNSLQRKKHIPPKKEVISVTLSDDEVPVIKSFTDIKAVRRTKIVPKVALGSKYYTKGYVKKKSPRKSLIKNYKSDSDVSDYVTGSDEEYLPDKDISEEWEDVSYKKGTKLRKRKASAKILRKQDSPSEEESDSSTQQSRRSKVIDDGNQKAYTKRIRAYETAEFAKKQMKILENKDGMDNAEDDYMEFDGGLKIPNSIWDKLYKYQQTGLHWLYELHQQNTGGIIGDEMGLGKTIQVIAFLAALQYSNLQVLGDTFKGLGPVLLVCPATVMHQWVKEFHTWWPPFRAGILHESGSFVGNKAALIRTINQKRGILIMSYAGVVQHQTELLEKEWHYIILDEGHKIRNPDAKATLVVKQFRTAHRLILSGSPVQNNLKELWSLFDFIYPGKLGTLPVFMQQFSVPIVLGGYANASQVEVQTAYKCASILRDTIKPYLLRRMKSDVKMSIHLPNKSEQVLFCQFTSEQADLYQAYIGSKEVDKILSAKMQIFVGLINLRKICNHPDIFDGGPKILKGTDESLLTKEDQYGYYKRSGKMIVVESLLHLWHKQSHRVLLFTQSVEMLKILEIFIKSKGYTYLKMDGTSAIASRQPLIAKFNSDKTIFVFLLTTRVGGLGINLTGADRIIIYDPDWNPSTDAQARERAWRIGQDKQVTIYRLLSAGTIEEKIYHRQIFKQFVTNKVLKDPRQRRFFKSNDMYELFTFQAPGKQGTESSAIFAGTGSEVKLNKKPHYSPTEDAIHPIKEDTLKFSAKKREKMQLFAKKLSAELSKQCLESKTGDKLKTQKKINEFAAPKNTEYKNKETITSKEGHQRTVKKPKKRKALEVDGEKIDFLVKKHTYKPPQEDENKMNIDDDYVLRKLFKTTGVHSALQHDKILESSDPDYMIIEMEAKRVAEDAVKTLKASRRMCSRAVEGIPTWTGQSGGIEKRFGKKIKFGSPKNSSVPQNKQSSSSGKFDGSQKKSQTVSSSDILSAIKNRNKKFGTSMSGDEEDSSSMPSGPPLSTEFDELLVQLRNFVAFGSSVNGQASTQEILNVFQDKISPSQSAIFKSLLKQICYFSRKTDGCGVWYLKDEFQ